VARLEVVDLVVVVHLGVVVMTLMEVEVTLIELEVAHMGAVVVLHLEVVIAHMVVRLGVEDAVVMVLLEAVIAHLVEVASLEVAHLEDTSLQYRNHVFALLDNWSMVLG
jgi:hypothetical protein